MTDSRTLTYANGRELFEWAPGKAFIEPDGSTSGLTVFTRGGGRVKAAFGDTIHRHVDGSFSVTHAEESS